MDSEIVRQQREQLRFRGRKALGALILALLVLGMLLFGATADETRFFRIGTGSAGGIYAPVGDALAEAISGPESGAACPSGQPCGIEGLVGIARPSFGAAENLENIRSGIIESGFIQSDLAYWALRGEALYEAQGPMEGLRAIAGLYPEFLHIVVADDSAIRTPTDLIGKRVSLGPDGSGTLVDARLVLEVYGFGEEDIMSFHLTFEEAARKLAADQIDAFFAIGGVPLPAIAALADERPIRLLPLDEWAMDKLASEHPFLSHQDADMSSYGLPTLDSISVQAMWVTSENVPEDIVYEITKTLWLPETGEALARSHPRGETLKLGSAGHCLAIPLHAGAARYYDEQGDACQIPEVGTVKD